MTNKKKKAGIDLFRLMFTPQWLVRSHRDEDKDMTILCVVIDLSSLRNELPFYLFDDMDTFKYYVKFTGVGHSLSHFELIPSGDDLFNATWNSLPALMEDDQTWLKFMNMVWENALYEMEELHPGGGWKDVSYSKNASHLKHYFNTNTSPFFE